MTPSSSSSLPCAIRGIGITFVAAIALVVGSPAQDPGHVHEPFYTTRKQEPDGSWSAERGGGTADARLRVTALMLLAKLGDGVKFEPDEQWRGTAREHEPVSLRRGVQWLRQQLDKKGRFGIRPDAAWLLDHAMATYVLAEALRLCNEANLESDLCRAMDALRQQVGIARPPVGAQVRLWGEMIVRSVGQLPSAEPGADRPAPQVSAKALTAAIAALPAVEGKTPREQAAANLRLILAGGEGEPVTVAWLAEPLHDPLTSFYVALAAWHRGGGKEWLDVSKLIERDVMKTQVRTGPDHGSWQPVGDFGKDNGCYGTTAVAILVGEIYYHRSCLDFVRGE